MASRRIDHTSPYYPVEARRAQIEGNVVIDAVISKGGEVIETKIISSPHPFLSRAALDAVKKFRYKPMLVDGRPFEVETKITVIFRLGS